MLLLFVGDVDLWDRYVVVVDAFLRVFRRVGVLHLAGVILRKSQILVRKVLRVFCLGVVFPAAPVLFAIPAGK